MTVTLILHAAHKSDHKKNAEAPSPESSTVELKQLHTGKAKVKVIPAKDLALIAEILDFEAN